MVDAQTHFEQGQACQKQNKLNEAIAEFKEAIQLNPFYTEAHREYMNLMIAQGKKTKILAEYQATIQQNPSSEVYHYLLGRILDDTDDKFREFKKAVEINPNYPWGHLGLGWIYRSKGMLDEAMHEYKEAIKIKPDFAEAHNNLGNAYRKQGKLDEGIVAYKKAISLNPKYAKAHNNLGNAYRKQGKLLRFLKHRLLLIFEV
ncbi:tetratricopeptide repeat protein [Candidatus Poribacteria bacterium]|nr:tetratricopeptide repeat protein [Candidatus Poribacteria bacterium]